VWEQRERLVVQFSVHFEGEQGVDVGALTRSMFNRFIAQGDTRFPFVVVWIFLKT
jgi:hypothetical protein